MSDALQWHRSRSYLMPIGGGPIPDSVGPAMKNLTGSDEPTVLIVASDADDGQRLKRRLFEPPGGTVEITTLQHIKQDDPSTLAILEFADIVFLGGGDQVELVRLLQDTRAEETLLRRLSEGVVIAGTSAGASAMGRIMPCGGTGWGALRCGGIPLSDAEDVNEDVSPQPVVIGEGLALMGNVIIDQHFFARDRFGRLAYLVSRYREQEVVGLGLDESTAAVIDWADERMLVLGNGSAAVLLAARFDRDTTDEPGPLTSFGLEVNLLAEGYGYDIGRRRPMARQDARDLVAATIG